MTDVSDRLTTVAVVLAGGTGSRFGQSLPKQLLTVAGRTVLEHTVEALHGCDEVDELVVVMTPDFVSAARQLLHPQDLPKLTAILPGGRDRSESTRIALAALGHEECNVLLHDAARPLLSRRVVSDCVEALRTAEAVNVAIPSVDTILRVDAGGRVLEIPDRSVLRRAQTPQGFRLSTIRRAYELAAEGPDLGATDDCAVVLRYLPEVAIEVVQGEERNLKVTFPVDLLVVDTLLQTGPGASRLRTPAGRAEALAGKVVVVLGVSDDAGRDMVALAEQAGCRVFSFNRSASGTDVRDPGAIAEALQQAHGDAGRIDAVVLTSPEWAGGPLAELDDARVLEQVQLGCLAPVHVARAARPYLQDSAGHLLVLAPGSGTRGRTGDVLALSARAALVSLLQGLAGEWSSDGIRVNVVDRGRGQPSGQAPEEGPVAGEVLAATALDVLASDLTGQVVDARPV